MAKWSPQAVSVYICQRNASASLAHMLPHDLEVLTRWQYASVANTAMHLDMSVNCASLGLEKV